MSLTAQLCRPFWTVQRLRRRGAEAWPRLPRPCISVGNLAFGGRGKTPITAALALAAREEGLRPAILVRGYGARRYLGPVPRVLCGDGGGSDLPVWRRAVSDRGCSAADRVPREAWRWAPEVGDESAWLAATCPGVPVGVHPRRDRSARAVLEGADVDLFLLDDGFQTRVGRDLDLVVLDPDLDPPLARSPGPCREGPDALRRADRILVLDPAEVGVQSGSAPLPPDWLPLRRRAGPLRWLHSGALVPAGDLPPLRVAAGVGSPDSVCRLALQQGLKLVGEIPVRDHRAPSRLALRRAGRGAVLVTEKDAVGWAAASPPAQQTVVLGHGLEGVPQVWAAVREVVVP